MATLIASEDQVAPVEAIKARRGEVYDDRIYQRDEAAPVAMTA